MHNDKNENSSIDMLSHDELIEILAEAFRQGSLEIVEPFLSENFLFRSQFIFGDPKNREESIERLNNYLIMDKGSQMLKVKSPNTGNTWLRFSESPRSSHIGMLAEEGKIRFVALTSTICD